MAADAVIRTESIILWGEVDKLLPLTQEPDVRQARKDLFKKLLRKGHKTLTIEDVQKGMKKELRHDMGGSYIPGVKEMTKTIRYAFKAACDLAPPTASPKKSPCKKQETAKVATGIAHVSPKKCNKADAELKGKSVDKREFHAFLMALKFYLEIEELFERMDGTSDDDQKLSCREAMKGKDKLAEWGISEEMLRARFEGHDVWESCMKFDAFAEWVAEERMGSQLAQLKLDDSDDEEVQYHLGKAEIEKSVDATFKEMGASSDVNRMKVRDTFDKWDENGDGGITFAELTAVMAELNPRFTEARVRKLFEAADTSKDGLIDFDEFLAFVFR